MAGDLIKNKIFIVILILGFIFTTGYFFSTNYTKVIEEVRTKSQPDYLPDLQPVKPDDVGYLPPKKRFLDGCHHVYLDVGTNIGIQIRKLYEPEKYESALIHPVFLEYFHRNLNELSSSLPYICAIGFEPNPNHEQMLKNLNDAYDKCNWKVKILTQTAVSDHDGITNFYSDHDKGNLEWGGTVFDRSKVYGQEKDKNDKGIPIQLIRLATFINNEVGQRELPKIDEKILGKPSVVMKIDIEGSEVEVIEDLVMQGSLQHIDVMMVEFHTRLAQTEEKKNSFRNVKDVITKIGEVSEYLTNNRENVIHKLKVLDLDDESYYLSNYTLPVCT